MNQTAKETSQKMGPPLEMSFFPRTNDLQRLMGLSLRVLQMVHSSLRVTFLVVLDFFLKMGLVCPPNPDCLASYLLFPCLRRESLPFLYWDTLWTECLVHFLQWVFICLGTWTYQEIWYRSVLTILLLNQLINIKYERNLSIYICKFGKFLY